MLMMIDSDRRAMILMVIVCAGRAVLMGTSHCTMSMRLSFKCDQSLHLKFVSQNVVVDEAMAVFYI